MMNTGRKCIERIKKQIDEIKFRIKIKYLDAVWYYTGGSCREVFPPSFYYTHTEEEIKRIKEDTIKELYEMIEQME